MIFFHKTIPLCFGLLMSVYPCPGELRRVFAQDWVRTWAGWTEASAMIASASDSQDENQIAEDVVVRFSRINVDNVHERFMSDQDRQLMLLDEGLHLGKGEAHGASNSCLADSLLQLLIWHNVISKALFDSSSAEKKWRPDVCLAARAHLCNHEEVALHPRQRDSTSAVVQDATAEEHTLAYLEHHRHGIAIVKLFLTYSGPVQDEARKGFRIVVHSRSDERVDPFLDARTFVCGCNFASYSFIYGCTITQVMV